MIPVVFFALLSAVTLPEGAAPEALTFSHFPDRLHAFVWRNWQLAPLERMAAVVGASQEELLTIGKAMGLPDPPEITESRLQRTYITLIRANWHLLNYDQLLTLLGWDAARLAYTLQEDDFLFISQQPETGVPAPDLCAPNGRRQSAGSGDRRPRKDPFRRCRRRFHGPALVVRGSAFIGL